MIKCFNNNNKLVISHIEDIDGMGSIILANIFWDKQVDYVACTIPEVAIILKEVWENYEEIYICDLPLDNEAISLISSDVKIQDKIKHFDHHASELDNAKKYSFINEVVNLNNKQTSGTELFYNYLLSLDANNKINQDYFKEFVEATRSADVWDLKSSLIDLGRSLGTLHSILGPEAYISIFSNNEIKEHFYIDKMYLSIINSADKDKENYVDSCLDKVLITKYQNYNIGVSLSENYRSFVGNSIASKYKDLIDFALIINLQKMKCSLRGIKDDIDLGKVAQSFAQNGGGHKKAAGFYINDECIDIIEKFVVEYIRSKK